MSLLDTLRKNLDSETFAKVTDALGDDFNYDMVPRTRLNKVIAQRDEARRQLAESQTGGAGPDDDDDDDSQGAGGAQPPKSPTAPQGGLTQKDLDKAVENARKEGEAKIKEMQLQFAATEKLRESKFVDPALVLSAGMIDFSKVTTDDKGVITGGLEDQIKAIAKDRPYLLQQSGGAPSGTGKDGGVDFGTITTRDEFMKLSTDKQLAFKAANPEAFQGFMSQL